MAANARIRPRRDTAANWTAANPVLADGEMGVDTTNLKFKIGDGTTAWASLSYVTGATGATGAAGADGKTVLSGTVNPTTEGVDGDFYINTSAHTVFGPKSGGAWGSGTSLVGPTGSTGATGPKGDPGSPGEGYATRTALKTAAATATDGDDFYLTESGRAGKFIFRSGNYSSQVTADTLEGVYMAASGIATTVGALVRDFGISNWTSAKWFGVKGDGATDDTSAINTTITICNSLGLSVLQFPPGTYLCSAATPNIVFGSNNLVVQGHGATLSFPTVNFDKVVAFNGNSMTFHGLTIAMTGATGDPSAYVEINGSNITFQNVAITKAAFTAHIPFYIRSTASGFTWRGGKLDAYGGPNCFDASNLLFDGVLFTQTSTASSDDGIAIKAQVGNVSNVKVVNCTFVNKADFIGLGSQVGTLGAADSTYSKGVYGVVLANNIGINCTTMAYIKPGAIDGSAYDYRDGTVAHVVVENNVIYDPSGTFFQRAIILSGGRGARIRDVTGRNNKVEGRSLGGGRTFACIDLYIPDYSATYPGTAAPSISNVDLGVTYYDPYNGAAAGGTAPGSPTTDFVNLEKQTSTHGTVSNITLDIVGNGCSLSGINILDGFDNAVHVRRFFGANIDTNLSSSYGGILTRSAITVGNEISMTMAAGSTGVQYKINGTGSVTPLLTQQVAALSLIGNATNAAATATQIAAASDGQVMRRSGTGIGFGAVNLASANAVTGRLPLANASGPGYVTGDGSAVAQATSKSTGVTINKSCGAITMNNAALASGNVVAFVVTNSTVAATDTINLNLASGAASNIAYRYWVSTVAAGSFTIAVENRSAGSLSENLVLNFAVVKSVAA